MKTRKLFLVFAGFALTNICFGQLLSQNRSNLLFYTSYYNSSDNRIEHQINEFPPHTFPGDHFDATVLARTYFVPIEFDLEVEPWMSLPFESSFYEEEIVLESWMSSPFENSYYEEDIEIETWMTRPFRISQESDWNMDEEIEIETWMTTPWI